MSSLDPQATHTQPLQQAWAHSTAAGVARQVAGALLVLGAILGCAGFGPPIITDGGYPPLRLDPESVQAVWRSRHPPQLTAAAALVVDLDSGQTLYGLKPEDKLPPASTVKIMTALVTLQRANLDEVVQVSARASGMEGSRMGLVSGERLTVRDLLYGLLLPSGNDAAVALAEHVAGSEEEFVALMNATATELGLRGTHFTSSHGLGSPDETMSAADLVVLTRKALADPVFSEIVATPSATIAGHSLENTNQLLKSFAGADGVKTGTTDEAGECLVASATRNGHRQLVVLLGSQDRYGEASALFNWVSDTWQWRRLELPNDALAWESNSAGQRYRLRAAEPEDVFLATWQWPLAHLNRALNRTVSLTSTLPVGTLTLSLGGKPLVQLPLGVWTNP